MSVCRYLLSSVSLGRQLLPWSFCAKILHRENFQVFLHNLSSESDWVLSAFLFSFGHSFASFLSPHFDMYPAIEKAFLPSISVGCWHDSLFFVTWFWISHGESQHNVVPKATAMKMAGEVTSVTGSSSGLKRKVIICTNEPRIKASLAEKALCAFEELGPISLPFCSYSVARETALVLLKCCPQDFPP